MARYRAVSWQAGESFDEGKLDNMTENDKFLYERLVPVNYTAYGLVRTEGLKILSGVIEMPPKNAQHTEVDVEFPPGYFTVGSRPVVTATFQSMHRRRSMVSIRGRGGNRNPDHSGFHVTVAHQLNSGQTLRFDNPDGDPNRIVRVHFIAIGW